MGCRMASWPGRVFVAGLAISIAGPANLSHAQSVTPGQGTIGNRGTDSGRVPVGALVGAGVAAGALLLGLTLQQTQAASGPVSEPGTTPPQPVRGRPGPVLSQTSPTVPRNTPGRLQTRGSSQTIQQIAPRRRPFRCPWRAKAALSRTKSSSRSGAPPMRGNSGDSRHAPGSPGSRWRGSRCSISISPATGSGAARACPARFVRSATRPASSRALSPIFYSS